MPKMKLVVDSSCDLPSAFYKQHNIGVADLLINFGEETYVDRKEITSQQILDKVEKTKVFPKTAALNMANLNEIFTKQLAGYDHIFFMPISSSISSIYNNACVCANDFDGKVTVLDSHSLSSGIGLLSLGILKDIEDGRTVEEIVQNHESRLNRINMSFTIETMDYLYKGGRCGGLTFLLGNKFHLHPIVRLENGKMGVHKIVRGKDIGKGLEVMCQEFQDNLAKGNIDLDYPVFIPNVVSPHGVREIRRTLERLVGNKILMPIDASGIICCHCGANTCGLAYMMKEPLGKK
ncbi:MAG: DegV family protein [Bacilli bacterium]